MNSASLTGWSGGSTNHPTPQELEFTTTPQTMWYLYIICRRGGNRGGCHPARKFVKLFFLIPFQDADSKYICYTGGYGGRFRENRTFMSNFHLPVALSLDRVFTSISDQNYDTPYLPYKKHNKEMISLIIINYITMYYYTLYNILLL